MASTGPGEIARELREQHRLEERALVDPLPTRRVGGLDATPWLSRAVRSEGGCGPDAGAVAAAMPGDPRRSCSAASSPSSAPSDCSKEARAAWDRVLEERHIRVGRIAGAGFGRLRVAFGSLYD